MTELELAGDKTPSAWRDNSMDNALLRKKPDKSLVIQEMREHGGEFVALNTGRVAIAYGTTEEELASKLASQGLQLNDFLISRVPEWDCGFVY